MSGEDGAAPARLVVSSEGWQGLVSEVQLSGAAKEDAFRTIGV